MIVYFKLKMYLRRRIGDIILDPRDNIKGNPV